MQPILSQFILFLFDFNPYRVYLRYILHFLSPHLGYNGGDGDDDNVL